MILCWLESCGPIDLTLLLGEVIMAILLKWDNDNVPGNPLYVYRKEGPTSSQADPGVKIATLDSAAKQYSDATIVPGTAYSYIIEVVVDLGSVWSRPTTTADMYMRGPGPQTILRGDNRHGYMGQVSSIDVPDMASVFNWPGLNSGAWLQNSRWHKFIRKGKIYFVPNFPLSNGAVTASSRFLSGSWVLDNFGVASGVEWAFDKSKNPQYLKTNIVTHRGNKFHVRAPRGFTDDWDGNSLTAGISKSGETEINQLIQPMIQGSFYPNSVGRIEPNSIGLLHSRAFICAETKTNTVETLMKVGDPRQDNFWVKSSFIAGCVVDNTYNATRDQNQPIVTGGPSPIFWPVLELIEE